MATYVFPPRSEPIARYMLRLFAIYGAFAAAVGLLACVIILGIAHSASTILALACLALGIALGSFGISQIAFLSKRGWGRH